MRLFGDLSTSMLEGNGEIPTISWDHYGTNREDYFVP